MRPSQEIMKAQQRVLQGRKAVARLREWMENGSTPAAEMVICFLRSSERWKYSSAIWTGS